jgi:hypothetical protein
MHIIEREVAPPEHDPSEDPAERDRPYWLDREAAAGGTGAPHLHREPDAARPGTDRFWPCQRKSCRKRPVYMPAGPVVAEVTPTGFGVDALREAVAAKHRAERPRRVATDAWNAYAKLWSFAYDPSPAAVEARRKAEAEELASAERRRAEEAGDRAAAEAWVCAEHPDGLPFASNWSGTWTARCGTGDCERGWPAATTEDPRALLAEDPDGWQCSRHGLEAIRKLRWDRDHLVRSCAWCPEMDHPRGQPVKPTVAATEAYFASRETEEARAQREREEARRLEAARVAALPRCAACYLDSDAHVRNPPDHAFEAMTESRMTIGIGRALVVAGAVAALLIVLASATAVGTPFHGG